MFSVLVNKYRVKSLVRDRQIDRITDGQTDRGPGRQMGRWTDIDKHVPTQTKQTVTTDRRETENTW